MSHSQAVDRTDSYTCGVAICTSSRASGSLYCEAHRRKSPANGAAKSTDIKIPILWCIGIVLIVVGLVVAVVVQPTTEVGTFGGTEDTGSKLGFVLGLFVAGIGQMMVAVGIIATGVRLGMNAREHGVA